MPIFEKEVNDVRSLVVNVDPDREQTLKALSENANNWLNRDSDSEIDTSMDLGQI